MARIARQNLSSLYFHVMVQGINKEYIFSNKEMKEKYKKLLKDNVQESNVKILSYCIMTNHAHILMYVENFQEISKLMQKINTSFARIYNRKNNRVVFVFRDRFTVQQISGKQHLYNCLSYIHNNPVKAGIVKNPQDYEYSSYREWVSQKEIIDEMSDVLIFGEAENNMNEFNKIHLNNNIYDIEDVVDVVDYKQIIAQYEKDKGRTVERLIKDEEILRDIVWELKNESNLSIRQISSILKINRPKITKIVNAFKEE